MAKKEFQYRGKSLEDLQKLSINEFAELVPSRSRRSLLRGFNDEEKRFLAKVRKKGDNIKTHCRDCVILPEFVGKRILIHRGNAFEPIIIQAEMIGHRLGEFALTRKHVKHTKAGVGASKGGKVKVRK